MSIKNIIMNLFHRRSSNDISQSDHVDEFTLIDINKLVKIPLKEELNDYKEKIDELIKRYQLLIEDNNIEEIDNFIKNNSNKMTMYIDIVRKACSAMEDENLMKEMYFDTGEFKKLNLMIKSLKLKNYLLEVNTIKQNTLLSLVALNEILGNLIEKRVQVKEEMEIIRKKRFWRSRAFADTEQKYINISQNIDTVKQLMNHFASSILIIENQKNAINLEINTKLSEIEYLNINIKQDEELLVQEKLNSVVKYAQVVNTNEMQTILNLNIDDKLKIVLLECALEKYVYWHKEELICLNQEIDKLWGGYPLYYEMVFSYFHLISDDEEKQNVLEKLSEMELRYKIFDYYSDNLVSKEFLEKLYLLKFKMVASKNLNNEDVEFVTNDTNYAEMECYDKIVMSKINYYLNNFKASDRFLSMSNCVELLRDENGEFLTYKILKDKVMSRFFIMFFLQSSDRYEQFKKFINLKVKTKRFEYMNFCEDLFDWDNEVSIESILMLETVSKIKTRWLSTLSDWWKTYINQDNNYFKLPEGIIEIGTITGWRGLRNLSNINPKYLLGKGTLKDDSRELLNNINKFAYNKTLILPSTLYSICGCPFDEAKLKNVVLNDGLYSLNVWTFCDVKLNYLTIPSSLKYIDLTVFDLTELKYIVFKDYENSNLWNNDEALEVLFKRIFSIQNVAKYLDKGKILQENVLGSSVESISFISVDGYVYLIDPRFKVQKKFVDGGKYEYRIVYEDGILGSFGDLTSVVKSYLLEEIEKKKQRRIY